MVRKRIYGEDNVWGKWLRAQGGANGALPAAAKHRGYVVTDWDVIIHEYKTPVDAQGTRDVHCLLCLECKTRMAEVNPSQAETLLIHHQLLAKKQKLMVANKRSATIYHFGVAVLRCEGDDPALSSQFEWGRFNDSGILEYKPVGKDIVFDLIGFRLNPDTLRPISFRRHHVKKEVWTQERTALGLNVLSRTWRKS